MEGISCNWDTCKYVAETDNWTNNIKAMELHERGKHGVKMAPVAQPKEEQVGDAQEEKGEKKRQEKRAQAKLQLFEEVETREEFRRKTQEFYTYATRTNLKTEEQAEDLYSACFDNTPEEEAVGVIQD